MYITGFFDILGTGLYFIGSYFFYRTLTCFLEPRRQFIRRAVSYLIGLCVCSVVIFPRDVVNITVTIPLFFAMLLIGFRQKILVKASVVLMFFPIVISFNFLIQQIGTWIWINMLARNEIANAVLSNLSYILNTLFWYWFWKISENKTREMVDTLDEQSWLLLDAVCLASLTAVMSCVYYTPKESYKVWLCMLACLITNFASIRLVFYLAENIRGRLEQKNEKLQQDYYRELEAGQQELRKFRHDMNNHFSVVAGLMDDGKEEEAKIYFRKLSGQLSAKGRSFCRNSIVNAVLNAKYNRALEQGIDCFFNIEIDELFFIDPLDICTIFSNTLDNAIEACMKTDPEKRRISMKARCTKKGYFSFEIENSTNEEVLMENGRFRTWKKEKQQHGIGIENVKDVVRRYQGTVDITYDAETFCVVILIAEGSRLA